MATRQQGDRGALRLCLFEASLDEVVVHVEEPDADLVEHHVQPVAQGQGLLSSLSELSQSQLLQPPCNVIK